MSLSQHIRESKPGNDPRIIAGYSIEMLDGAISQLSAVERPGEWERDRLQLLKRERALRAQLS